jgi:hypothetical protein
VTLRRKQDHQGSPALGVPIVPFVRLVPQTTNAVNNRTPAGNRAALTQDAANHAPGKPSHPPSCREQALPHRVGEFKPLDLIGFVAKEVAKGAKIIELQQVLRMGSVRRWPPTGPPAEVNVGPDAEEEVVGLERTRIRQLRIDFVAVPKILAAEAPDTREKDPQAVVLDVEGGNFLRVHLRRPGPFAPALADMEKMRKGIKGRPNTFPETNRQAMRVIDRLHVEKGIELLPLQLRHVIKVKGQGLAGKPAFPRKSAAMDGLSLKLLEERVSVDRIVKKEDKIGVGTGRHFVPPRPTQGDHRKGTLVAEFRLLAFRPVRHDPAIDRAAGSRQGPPIVEVRRAKEGIVGRNQAPVSGERIRAADLGPNGRVGMGGNRHQTPP